MTLAEAITADLSASTDPHAAQALDLLTEIITNIKGVRAMAYEWELDEWRAGRDRGQTCYRHDYRPNRNGGGTCTGCGDTIDAEEIG